MLKNLTILALAGALLPACVINAGGTDTATDSDTVTPDTGTDASGTDSSGGTTAEPVTDSTIGGTGTGTGTDTTDAPTTDAPTTGDPTSVGTTTEQTSGTTEGTTGEALYGNCGWYADPEPRNPDVEGNYYECADAENGVVGGVSDPEGLSPIDCPADLVEGEKCDEDVGPVKGVGCCTPEGVLYFCDSEGSSSIVKIVCD